MAVTEFQLRQPTKKYHLLHEAYAGQDRKDIRLIAEAFAEKFGIFYEKVKISKKGMISFWSDDSDFYGNGSSSVGVPLWLTIKWANLYCHITTYKSEHLVEPNQLN